MNTNNFYQEITIFKRKIMLQKQWKLDTPSKSFLLCWGFRLSHTAHFHSLWPHCGNVREVGIGEGPADWDCVGGERWPPKLNSN